jgi:Ran GTPase-activating protein (RanGAP) involved in mRNA processing and transport
MLCELQEGTTPFEYTMSGLDLGPIRCGILARNINANNTLLSLHISRKRVGDAEGCAFAKMLEENTSLRKLELEGNLLGPKSAAAFGYALKRNSTLRLLNLESNQLTVDGQDMWGIYEFVDFLDHN